MLSLPFDVPVDPDAPEARDWLLDELSKQQYQAAQPTFIDRVAQQILQWLEDVIDWLLGNGTAGTPADVPVGLLAVLIPIVVILLVAFLVYGLPRLNRRSAVTGALFGDDDARDAMSMRRAAERAAAAGDYTLAIAELFRSIARGLAERTLVATFPGTPEQWDAMVALERRLRAARPAGGVDADAAGAGVLS